MLTDKTRKKILENFLQIIDGISDKEYQKRVWIRGEGPECYDFDEAVCDFSYMGDDVINRHKEFHLTELQYEILKDFREQFKAFYDENDWPPKFIESPEWAKIMDLAKQVVKSFNYKKRPWMPCASFERPKGIPDNYLVRISDRGSEVEYIHPTNPHIRVRVMTAKGVILFPYQDDPYVIQTQEGKAFDKFGNRVPLDVEEAHIPLEEFVYRS